jgi:hypothetical protein
MLLQPEQVPSCALKRVFSLKVQHTVEVIDADHIESVGTNKFRP